MDTQLNPVQAEPDRYRLVTWYLPYLMLAGIAFLWPADRAVLGLDFREWAWVQSVPSIAAYVRKSAFPSAVAAHLVMTGALFLPLLVLVSMRPEIAYPNRARARSAALKFIKWRPFAMVLMFSMGVGCVWIGWAQPGYEYSVLPISTQRWALAMAGPVFSFFGMAYVGCFAAVVSVRFSFCSALEELGDGVE